MRSSAEITALIDEKLSGSGIFLVDIRISNTNLIKVEIDHKEGVSIQQCVELSRFLENALDRETEDFELQVSSPGLGSAFKVPQQYEKNVGRSVEVTLKDGRTLKGTLIGLLENGLTLESSRKERMEGKKKKQLIVEKADLSFEEIEETKSVISFK